MAQRAESDEPSRPQASLTVNKLSSKQMQLALVLVGLGAVLYVQFQRGAFSGAPSAPDLKAVGKTTNIENLPSYVQVNIDRPEEVKIRERSRNLFNYSKSPDQVVEEERQRREAERLAREAEERRQKEQQEQAARAAEDAQRRAAMPPPPPQAPAINFHFIGKMGQSKAPLAILADGNETFTVREGEVIKDTFKLIKIDYDAVTIGYTKPEWTDTKTIKMGT